MPSAGGYCSGTRLFVLSHASVASHSTSDLTPGWPHTSDNVCPIGDLLPELLQRPSSHLVTITVGNDFNCDQKNEYNPLCVPFVGRHKNSSQEHVTCTQMDVRL